MYGMQSTINLARNNAASLSGYATFTAISHYASFGISISKGVSSLVSSPAHSSESKTSKSRFIFCPKATRL